MKCSYRLHNAISSVLHIYFSNALPIRMRVKSVELATITKLARDINAALLTLILKMMIQVQCYDDIMTVPKFTKIRTFCRTYSEIARGVKTEKNELDENCK